MIAIRPSRIHDRGVFATQGIAKGKIVLADHVTIFEKIDRDTILGTQTLVRYYWNWDIDTYCLVHGYGSLLNHSHTPNVFPFRHYKQRVMVFKTLRIIEADEELLVDYQRG